jgi:hypothetical protein
MPKGLRYLNMQPLKIWKPIESAMGCDHGFALPLPLYYDEHGVLNGSKGALRSYSLYGMVANLKHQSFFNTRW